MRRDDGRLTVYSVAIPLPILLLPWLVAVAVWLTVPWLIRRGVPEGVVRWTPPALALVGLGFLWLTLSGDPTPQSGLRNPVPATAASVDAGRQLYAAHCAECHGVDARGGGPGGRTTAVPPPSLVSGHLMSHTDGDIYYWISNGLPGGMPAWAGTLTEEERWHLVNYLRAMNEGISAEAEVSQTAAGVCVARQALPGDHQAAVAAFTNQAHAALHALAAEPELDRSLAAALLEAKARVEADIAESAAEADIAESAAEADIAESAAEALEHDLADLHAAVDAALRDLGQEVPPCELD